MTYLIKAAGVSLGESTSASNKTDVKLNENIQQTSVQVIKALRDKTASPESIRKYVTPRRDKLDQRFPSLGL